MRKDDLNAILVDKVKATGGFFRPAEYRFALFLAAPTRQELEKFVRLGLHQACVRSRAHLSVLPPDQESLALGERNSPIRAGLLNLIDEADVLVGQAKSDPNQQKTRDVLLDLAEDEVISLENWFPELRRISNRRLERMPERLQKSRSLAEQALHRFFMEGELEQDDWLREAQSHLEDLLDQPVGQRDPFTWMLQAWVALRRDKRDIAQNGFLQACLASSSERDALFFEANRCLAMMQTETNAFAGALQTLQKGGPSQGDPTLLLDQTRCAIMADRIEDSESLVREAFHAWPLIGLALFAEPALLARASQWRSSLEEAARSVASEAREAAASWQGTLSRVQRNLEAFDDALALDPSLTAKVDNLTQDLEELDAFYAWWLVREASAGEEEATRAGAMALQGAVKDAQQEFSIAQKQVEELKSWRNHRMDQISRDREHTVQEHRDRLGLRPGDDHAQAGCMLAGGAGCAGYALYFIACMVSASFAATAGPNSSNGKTALAALAIPFVIGVLYLVVDGIRRMVAERELGHEMRRLDAEGEKAVKEIDAEYRAKAEPLVEAVEEARARRDQATDALRRLQSLRRAPDAEAEAA